LNGKIKYNGTEKIEKKIYEEIEEKINERLDAIANETRHSIIQEIREELQPETVPYDRLRLIEQRIHEISITQDGIVREIVDIKTSLNALSREIEKNRAPDVFEAKKQTYEAAPSLNSNPYESKLPESGYYERESTETAASESPFSSYTPYLPAVPIEPRRSMQPPGFGASEQNHQATPIVPVSFNSRRSDGWEYQEFVPKKNNAEPEKFVPAKTIQADNDPFYFADGEEEILDVSQLREPAAGTKPPMATQSSFENVPLTIHRVKQEEKETPDRAEYIVGSNQKGKYSESDEDNNANCEYIIAEKDTGQRRQSGRRSGKPRSELKEKVISSDEDDTEIFSYE